MADGKNQKKKANARRPQTNQEAPISKNMKNKSKGGEGQNKPAKGRPEVSQKQSSVLAATPGNEVSKSQKTTMKLKADTGSIDDLFTSLSNKKREQREKADAERKKEAEIQRKSKKAKSTRETGLRVAASGGGRSWDDVRPVRYDGELGMNIYSEEALRIGQGGGTDLCPFDCDCCF